MAVTPYYNRPPQEGLVRHFHAIADATDLPMLTYDIPKRTGTAIELETMIRIAEHPRIVANKDAKGDLDFAQWGMASTGLAWYSGDDILNLPLLALGAAGMISVVGHLVGDRLKEMAEALWAGRPDEAAAINAALLPVYTGCFRTQGVILTKAALDDAGPARRARATAARRCDRRPARAAARRPRARRRARLPRMSHAKLPPPPPLADGALRIFALGGLGEIGRNMTVFEFGGRLLVVDCGVLFPEENQPGVDLILPDFGPIADRLDDIEAVVFTHGHEDHIGALPYLLRKRADIPVYGSRLTMAFIDAKMREHRISPVATVVEDGERVALGPFEVEFLAVNHSIPDAMALAIRTGAGVVLHTGDFKMDQLPLDGRITDLNGFARLGDAGVDVLMVDSTNAEVPGFVSSERDIVPGARRRLPAGRGAHHRGVVRVPRAPDPADHRHGGAARSQDRLRRADRWCATWASPATSAT